MIFRRWEQVLDSTKTQTRQLVKERDYLGWHLFSNGAYLQTIFRWKTTFEGHGIPQGDYYPLYAVGRTYAIQPRRGKKAVGRIRITAIRRERLQDITPSGILAEGIDNGKVYYGPNHGDYTVKSVGELRHEFVALWNSLHTKEGTRWTDDPEVFVLSFKLVEKEKK